MTTINSTDMHVYSVGQEVVVKRGSEHYLGVIDRETNAMWVARVPEFKGKGSKDMFFKKTPSRSWYGDAREGYGDARNGMMYPVSEDKLKEVTETNARFAKYAQEEAERRAAEKAKREAREAYLLTPEGVLETRREKEWFGYEIVTTVFDEGYWYKSAEVQIVVNGRQESRVSVQQDTDRDYTTRNKTVKRATVNWSALGSVGVEKATAYMEALKKATALAEEWNIDAGKVITRV
jgi:hypothetical protein